MSVPRWKKFAPAGWSGRGPKPPVIGPGRRAGPIRRSSRSRAAPAVCAAFRAATPAWYLRAVAVGLRPASASSCACSSTCSACSFCTCALAASLAGDRRLEGDLRLLASGRRARSFTCCICAWVAAAAFFAAAASSAIAPFDSVSLESRPRRLRKSVAFASVPESSSVVSRSAPPVRVSCAASWPARCFASSARFSSASTCFCDGPQPLVRGVDAGLRGLVLGAALLRDLLRRVRGGLRAREETLDPRDLLGLLPDVVPGVEHVLPGRVLVRLRGERHRDRGGDPDRAEADQRAAGDGAAACAGRDRSRVDAPPRGSEQAAGTRSPGRAVHGNPAPAGARGPRAAWRGRAAFRLPPPIAYASLVGEPGNGGIRPHRLAA